MSKGLFASSMNCHFISSSAQCTYCNTRS